MTNRRDNAGFTLIEMIVVISIIVILLATALPSMVTLFRSGSDAQARTQISSLLSTARGIAIRDGLLTGVYFQMDHEQDDEILSIIHQKDPNDPSQGFVLVDGCTPLRLPVGMAAGELRSDNLWKSSGNEAYGKLKTGDLGLFTTFAVLFDRDGRLVQRQVWIDTNEAKTKPLFDTTMKDYCDSNLALKPSVPENSMTALCIFNYKIAQVTPDLPGWLNQNARYLAVNPYTGGLVRGPTD